MLYSYKCILFEFETYFQRKPIRPFPKSCNMYLEQTYGKIHIYIYILYVYVSNQIQQNNMQPEHVSEAERFNIPLCVCALRSVAHGQSKAPLMFRSRSPVNRTRSDHALTLNVSSNVRPIYFFLFIVKLLNKCLN